MHLCLDRHHKASFHVCFFQTRVCGPWFCFHIMVRDEAKLHQKFLPHGCKAKHWLINWLIQPTDIFDKYCVVICGLLLEVKKKDLSSSRTIPWSCSYLVLIWSLTSFAVFSNCSSCVFQCSTLFRLIQLSIPTCHRPLITCTLQLLIAVVSPMSFVLLNATMAIFQFFRIRPWNTWPHPIPFWFTKASKVSQLTTSVVGGIGPSHWFIPALNFCAVCWHMPVPCSTFSSKCFTGAYFYGIPRPRNG